MSAGDRVVRAMTRDGTFRVVAARTTTTNAAVLAAQGTLDADARVLSDLATLAVLHRELMSPSMRVQALLRGAGESGSMIAESHPDGWTRGLAKVRGDAGIDLRGSGALLSLERPLRFGEMHVGTVAVPTDGTLASAAMVYFNQSEQITSMVALGSVLADDDGAHLIAAGGFVVQVLAEARDIEGPLAVLTLRLEEFVDLRERLVATDASPEQLIEEVLYGFDIEFLATSPLRFGCACSEERFLRSLATLDAPTLAELAASDEPIESRCDFCGTTYSIDPARLRVRGAP